MELSGAIAKVGVVGQELQTEPSRKNPASQKQFFYVESHLKFPALHVQAPSSVVSVSTPVPLGHPTQAAPSRKKVALQTHLSCCWFHTKFPLPLQVQTLLSPVSGR